MANCKYTLSGKQDSDNNSGISQTGIAAQNLAGDNPVDPTGVVLSNNTTCSKYEVNTDSVITQTLEGYVLPLLPTVPLHIHNIHLKCEVIDSSTSYYQALQLPSYKQNIGKHQVLDTDNVHVSYVFYPSGAIDIYTKNSENPFRLQTEED